MKYRKDKDHKLVKKEILKVKLARFSSVLTYQTNNLS